MKKGSLPWLNFVIVSLLLTLNKFHTLFWYFQCWLEINVAWVLSWKSFTKNERHNLYIDLYRINDTSFYKFRLIYPANKQLFKVNQLLRKHINWNTTEKILRLRSWSFKRQFYKMVKHTWVCLTILWDGRLKG